MTQQSTKKEYNTFVKGIITEAGPLTFPENASLDEENCVLNRDGSRQRRLGMDFEDDFVLRNVTVLSDDAVASFNWHNAANSDQNQFAVVQAGATLLVFDASEPSISANLIATLDLSGYITGKDVIGAESGMGYFFIFGGVSAPLYLSYDSTTAAVTITQFTIKIRDFFGVEDGLAIDAQPSVLTPEHKYNLLNQGWTAALADTYKAHTGSVYPANTQQWFVGKDSDENFQAAQLKKMDFGTSPAPKGRFIIDAFNRSTDRNSLSGFLFDVDDIETGYPSTVEFAFERLFYAGCESIFSGASSTKPNFTGYIFYSRTLRSPRDFGQCYSDADPTSEIDSDLVDTDGGYVRIPNCGKIHKLINKGSSVIVFADEGIWEIRGDEAGFRGTSFQTIKLTSFGVLSGTSVVDTEASILYWNEGGIYLLGPDEAGMLVARNITENSIQTLYNSLSQATKRNAVGTFDPINRRVTWMYNDESDYDGVSYKNKYNKELVLDLVLEAFYKHSISSYDDPSPYISGYLRTPDFVQNLEGVRSRGDSVTKYLTVQFLDEVTNAASVSFGYYKNESLRDWEGIDGVGVRYVSYLITGYEIMDDTTRNKQASYLILNFKRTELNAVLDDDGNVVPDNPSGCYVQAQWDWADHPDSGKWGQLFQGYRLQRPYILEEGQPINYGHSVISTKNRLPGRGKALSLYFQSEEDKDFYLYGWAIKLTGDSYV